MSPEVAGGFLTTGPPEKSSFFFFLVIFKIIIFFTLGSLGKEVIVMIQVHKWFKF